MNTSQREFDEQKKKLIIFVIAKSFTGPFLDDVFYLSKDNKI